MAAALSSRTLSLAEAQAAALPLRQEMFQSSIEACAHLGDAPPNVGFFCQLRMAIVDGVVVDSNTSAREITSSFLVARSPGETLHGTDTCWRQASLRSGFPVAASAGLLAARAPRSPHRLTTHPALGHVLALAFILAAAFPSAAFSFCSVRCRALSCTTRPSISVGLTFLHAPLAATPASPTCNPR